MPDYTTDERWRRGPRKHTARRSYNSARGGLVIRCEGCDYEPVQGTVREQEDAHRAHRVAMGENVKAQRVLPRGERIKQTEAQLAFIHAVLALSAKADLGEQLLWHSDGQHIHIAVNVSDVFDWGCADAEDLTPERLPLLEQAYTDLAAIHRHDAVMYTVDLYAARIRQMRPQGAAYPKERAATQALFDACGPARATGLGNPRKVPTPTMGDGEP
jgi:hypothetical protein